MKRPPKLIPCFGKLSDFSKQGFLIQSLISLPIIKQIKRFMDQNISWAMHESNANF